ncbi:hypothetical protein [Nocardioides mangrovi]|uniref:DUF4064 domain-containing protein n=1 Tax=Nocardioides mangrovi TaxID=2874580 RepID=A0ABS7UBD4_9ACTN|nr:hypothetical protein [Nocardioides mangrovi]MBZ5738309.1 hypothetical protein [Nocardioides mangrovi]
MTETRPRPRQVTLAAWLIMGGSIAVVLLVFDRLTGLQTLETRESVESFLSEPPGSDLGVGVDGVLSVIRTLGMVAAGCATAAAILGYQVLRRSRSARLAVTVLAVPLFVAGMVTGGFVPALVAASALMLWLQPARDWFSDNPPVREAPAPPVAPPMPSVPPAFRAPPPGAQPPAPPSHPGLPPRVWPAPYAGTPGDASAPRPSAVVWSCVLTWICTGVTAAGAGISALAFALEPDLILDEARRQSPELADRGITDTMLMTTTYVMLGFVVAWCLAAATLAVLTFRRIGWARIVLVVSASVTIAVSLLGTAMGGFLLVLPLLASVVTVAFLLRPDVRDYPADRSAAARRRRPSSITPVSLQKAQRTRCRPASES